MRKHLPIRCLSAAIAVGLTAQAFAADTVRMDAIEVTSSKTAQPVERASSRVTVIGGEELRQRGATDLRSALARVAGVEISQGGDGGPASSVPAFWGLREFDAFLLVVDGVPWGGAFTPALASLDLANIERIEVLRGAAPVSYGATAFVGVIQVVHYAAGEGPTEISFGIGSQGSFRAALALPFAAVGEVRQSLLLDAEQLDLSTDRSGFDRAHALYRLAMPLAAGDFGLDLDLSFLRQDPTSPSPQAGSVLSPLDGLNLTVTGNYVGDRFYNQRNTAVAPSYATWDASASYSAGGWTWRVDGSNLSNRRDAISESELGEGACYRMPARTYWASVSYRFQ